jgi:CRP-like cAMP-binding protein
MLANASGGLRPRNRLLASLSQQDMAHLLAGLEPVRLRHGDVLCQFNEKMPYIYFPDGGFISLVSTMLDGATAGIGLVGYEGMIGVPLFLGVGKSPYRAIVQIRSEGWRMKADNFREVVRLSGGLRWRLMLYTQSLMTQLSQIAACNCLHTIDKRLSCLLLMIHDRVESSQFFLTHEDIAGILGARRAGITVEAGKLRRAGVINYLRGQIHILDRNHLELSACECYRILKGEFDYLLEMTEDFMQLSISHSFMHVSGSPLRPDL